MRYCEIIAEDIEDKLYHATSVENFYEMLDANEISANTGHPITHTGGEKRSKDWAIRPGDITNNGYLKGVSLTRSVTFARTWKSRGWTSADRVILVLNGSLIRRDLRLMPISFWGNGVRREAEEFVNGPIKPLSKYLLKVEATKDVIIRYDLADNLKYFNFPITLVTF